MGLRGIPVILGHLGQEPRLWGLNLGLAAQSTSPPRPAHLTSGSAASTGSAFLLGSFCSGLKAEHEVLWDPLSQPESSPQEPLPDPWDTPAWATNPQPQAGWEDNSQSQWLPGASAAWADEGCQHLNLASLSPIRALTWEVNPFPAPPQPLGPH